VSTLNYVIVDTRTRSLPEELKGAPMPADLIEVPGYVAGTWSIDPTHSDVGFVIRHLMISKVGGHFTRFEGRTSPPRTC
jgi:polyisoprenoid-binding protein YceI